MLQNLASYFLGGNTTTSTSTTGGVSDSDNSSNRVALRTTDFDDGWTMVERDSEGNSDASSSEEEDNVTVTGLERVQLERTVSNESITMVHHHDMEESWFVTPPPCFSSLTGPFELRTSPLENLLIEHPSMSVYQRNGARHPSLRSPTPSNATEEEKELDVVEESIPEEPEPEMARTVVRGHPRRSVSAVVHLHEMQVAINYEAQKALLTVVSRNASRGYLRRANKAREVNGRNWNPRRKERSQGSYRSHANNNRKC